MGEPATPTTFPLTILKPLISRVFIPATKVSVGESFDSIPTCLIPKDYPGQEGCVSTSPALWGAVCEALPAHAVPGH